MTRVLAALLLLVLAACSGGHKLAECRGSTVAANPGKWTPTTEELR